MYGKWFYLLEFFFGNKFEIINIILKKLKRVRIFFKFPIFIGLGLTIIFVWKIFEIHFKFTVKYLLNLSNFIFFSPMLMVCKYWSVRWKSKLFCMIRSGFQIERVKIVIIITICRYKLFLRALVSLSFAEYLMNIVNNCKLYNFNNEQVNF